jgi:peptidoglycan/xylan/chitin deacetylase (PgdA/CDA1 family)
MRPADWSGPLLVLVANHLLLTLAGLLPRCRLLGRNWTRLPRAAVDAGQVALTFDDGPDPDVTPRVLDLLDRFRARATFFCIGALAERHPDLCREIVQRGHAIENHSQNHRYHFATFGPRRMAAEIDAGQASLGRIAGAAPRFFRPTAGLRNPFLDPLLARRGLILATWTRRGYDSLRGDAERVLSRLSQNLAAGDILLLHDGSPALTSAGDPVVLVVLPRLLERIQAAGLQSVTLRSALDAS